MSKKLIAILGGVLLLVVALAIYFGVRNAEPTVSEPKEPSPSVTVSPEPSGGEGELPGGEAEEEVADTELSATTERDSEVERLQEFLDDNNNAEILEQARFLLESEDPRRREAAIDALVWVSTPQAGKVLLSAMKCQDEETVHQAYGAMSQILNTLATHVFDDPETGELVVTSEAGEDAGALEETYDLWVEAGKAVNSVEDLDALLVTLSGLDIKFSVPVLVELLEDSTGERHEVVAHCLDMITDSTGVTNREEAAQWLMEQEKQ